MQPLWTIAGIGSRILRMLMCFFLIFANGLADDKMPTKTGAVEGITEYTLDNGLKILLFADKSQPKVTVNCTIFVGSRHEGYGETGMAHLLEHMLFKGTDLHPKIPEMLRDRGASFNGTTWLDRTNYYETLNATDENLEFAIRLEADRMINSKILNEDLQKEFTVVRSEFEQGENSPFRVLLQRMFSSAFQWHNYRNSTIGNRSDIERVPIDSLRAFYRKYYRPDNAMLIVAGSFDEKKALALIQKYFGVLEKPKTPVNQTYTVEPPQDGDRTTMVRRVADTQMVGSMYHVPAGGDPEFAAVDLLANILTDEPSGRLYKSLIETKKATSVGGRSFALHDPGAVFFMAQVPKEKPIEDAQNAMIETLENLATNPVTKEEVERARRQILNQREMAASKTDSIAVSLSEWASQGDWRLYFLYRDAVEKTTPEQVQLVAQKYLVRNNRTVGLYLPTDRSERIQIADRPVIKDLVAGYQGREAILDGEQFDPTPKNIEGRLIRGELKTGVPYAFLPKKTRGATVNLAIVLRFGDEKSLMGKSAACDMLGSLMERGTKSLDFQKLNDRKDELKAPIRIGSSQQTLRISLETKRETLMDAIALIGDILRNPAFDENEFNLLREQVLSNLEEQKREPGLLASLAVSRALSPYKRGDVRYVATIEEELEDFKKLKLADIKEIHTKYLSGTEGEVSVVGDFEPEEVETRLSALLSNWKSKIPYQRVADSAKTDLKTQMISIETPDKANANYVASQQYAIRDDHPKYPALLIGNMILGGGSLASRLADRVRKDEGLSYGISSSLTASTLDEKASFSVRANTNPVNRDKLVKVIDEEIRKFVKDGATEKELKDNIQGYLQNQQLTRARDSYLASLLANNLYTGRDMSYYEKLETAVSHLTVESVNEAVSEYISPDAFVIATAGDFAQPTQAKSDSKPKQ
ncbi:MAG: pitrilysin family protein [Pirellula sp.]